MGLLVFYICLALGVSFLCSILEAVLLSVTPSYVAVKVKSEPVMGERLRSLKDDIDRPLAAILSLNTIAHTVGAVGAGAQAAVVFGDAFIGIASAVLTLLILVISEIIPKTLGALYWRQWAPMIVRMLQPIIVLMTPLVWLAQFITHYLSRGKEKPRVERAEISAIAEVGAEQGVLAKQETHFLKNLLQFDVLTANDVMTPRTVIFSLPEAISVGEAVKGHPHFRFSRIPLYESTPDDITGYVLKDKILRKAAEDQDEIKLKELSRSLLSVTRDQALHGLFERMISSKEHIALVIDDYGGVAGLVTMEDIVETMLGLEILDESDTVEDMQEFARQKWAERAARNGITEDSITAKTRHGILNLTGQGQSE